MDLLQNTTSSPTEDDYINGSIQSKFLEIQWEIPIDDEEDELAWMDDCENDSNSYGDENNVMPNEYRVIQGIPITYETTDIWSELVIPKFNLGEITLVNKDTPIQITNSVEAFEIKEFKLENDNQSITNQEIENRKNFCSSDKFSNKAANRNRRYFFSIKSAQKEKENSSVQNNKNMIKNSLHEMLIETQVLLNLKSKSSTSHPNIIQIYGIKLGQHSHNFIITDSIYEMLPETIQKWIRCKRERSSKRNEESFNTTVTENDCDVKVEQRLEMSLEIASAISYLHDHNMVYFLRPNKIGLNTKDNKIKLCHFGEVCCEKYSKVWPNLLEPCSNVNDNKNTLVHILPYTAPEILCRQVNAVHNGLDVYSFGILLWHMITLSEPFSHILERSDYMTFIVKKHERPNLSKIDKVMKRETSELKKLLSQCWDPFKRPTMHFVFKRLRQMLLLRSISKSDKKPKIKSNSNHSTRKDRKIPQTSLDPTCNKKSNEQNRTVDRRTKLTRHNSDNNIAFPCSDSSISEVNESINEQHGTLKKMKSRISLKRSNSTGSTDNMMVIKLDNTDEHPKRKMSSKQNKELSIATTKSRTKCGSGNYAPRKEQNALQNSTSSMGSKKGKDHNLSKRTVLLVRSNSDYSLALSGSEIRRSETKQSSNDETNVCLSKRNSRLRSNSTGSTDDMNMAVQLFKTDNHQGKVSSKRNKEFSKENDKTTRTRTCTIRKTKSPSVTKKMAIDINCNPNDRVRTPKKSSVTATTAKKSPHILPPGVYAYKDTFTDPSMENNDKSDIATNIIRYLRQGKNDARRLSQDEKLLQKESLPDQNISSHEQLVKSHLSKLEALHLQHCNKRKVVVSLSNELSHKHRLKNQQTASTETQQLQQHKSERIKRSSVTPDTPQKTPRSRLFGAATPKILNGLGVPSLPFLGAPTATNTGGEHRSKSTDSGEDNAWGYVTSPRKTGNAEEFLEKVNDVVCEKDRNGSSIARDSKTFKQFASLLETTGLLQARRNLKPVILDTLPQKSKLSNGRTVFDQEHKDSSAKVRFQSVDLTKNWIESQPFEKSFTQLGGSQRKRRISVGEMKANCNTGNIFASPSDPSKAVGGSDAMKQLQINLELASAATSSPQRKTKKDDSIYAKSPNKLTWSNGYSQALESHVTECIIECDKASSPYGEKQNRDRDRRVGFVGSLVDSDRAAKNHDSSNFGNTDLSVPDETKFSRRASTHF